jgi:hypothetical protein
LRFLGRRTKRSLVVWWPVWGMPLRLRLRRGARDCATSELIWARWARLSGPPRRGGHCQRVEYAAGGRWVTNRAGDCNRRAATHNSVREKKRDALLGLSSYKYEEYVWAVTTAELSDWRPARAQPPSRTPDDAAGSLTARGRSSLQTAVSFCGIENDESTPWRGSIPGCPPPPQHTAADRARCGRGQPLLEIPSHGVLPRALAPAQVSPVAACPLSLGDW